MYQGSWASKIFSKNQLIKGGHGHFSDFWLGNEIQKGDFEPYRHYVMMENDILSYILNISFKPPLPSPLKVGFLTKHLAKNQKNGHGDL